MSNKIIEYSHYISSQMLTFDSIDDFLNSHIYYKVINNKISIIRENELFYELQNSLTWSDNELIEFRLCSNILLNKEIKKHFLILDKKELKNTKLNFPIQPIYLKLLINNPDLIKKINLNNLNYCIIFCLDKFYIRYLETEKYNYTDINILCKNIIKKMIINNIPIDNLKINNQFKKELLIDLI